MPILVDEKELEIYLMETEEDHFGLAGRSFNQVEIKGYGIIDILNINIDTGPQCKPYLEITILELKKGKIDYNAIGQISRYKTAIERLLSHWGVENKFIVGEISGILIGETYTNGDVCYLGDNIGWLRVYEHNINIEHGIEFKETHGWHSTSEDFSKIPLLDALKRDLAKSRIDSRKSWKNRLEEEKMEEEKKFRSGVEEFQVFHHANDGSHY